MNGEEFKDKFKVGDHITTKEWMKSDYIKSKYSEIVYISPNGEESGLYDDENGLFIISSEEDGWELYQTPPERKLEKLIKYYRVFKFRNGGMEIQVLYYNKTRVQELASDSLDVEYLTEKEAIDEGLIL
ncbi:hypothetical protein N9924_00215 [bacterium]|nr:hypothetical protein [bacterium]